MNPIDFPEANRTFTKPPGMSDEECQPLRVHDTGEALISRWALDPNERQMVAAGATVELWVFGRGHPVVSVQVGALPESARRATGHAPWDAFSALGPIPTETAMDLAINFEARQVYRDDFRWIVDSLLASRDEAAIAVKAAREERQACAAAQAELAALKLAGAGGGERTGPDEDAAQPDAAGGMEAARSGGTTGDATGAVIAGELAPAGPAAPDAGAVQELAKGAFRGGWALACHTIASQMRMLGAHEAAAKVDGWANDAPELETVMLGEGETFEQARARIGAGGVFLQQPVRGGGRG